MVREFIEPPEPNVIAPTVQIPPRTFTAPSTIPSPGETVIATPRPRAYTFAASAGGLIGDLVAAKSAIERRLLGTVQAAGAFAVAGAYEGVSNIVGVALSIPQIYDVAPQTAELDNGPGAPSLTLYLVEPMSMADVLRAIADAAGTTAQDLRRLPVTPIVTGLIDAQPHRFTLRPAAGGISVAHQLVTAGTLGCLATGRDQTRRDRLLILSNNHVLANCNAGVFGDCVCQPGPYDGGVCPRDHIANLERFVPLDFSGGQNEVDAATAWASPALVRPELMRLIGGSPQYFPIDPRPIPAALNMPVSKSGRTTQLTQGTITATTASIQVNYGAGRIGNFINQIAIQGTGGQLFSAGGDSGSLIFTLEIPRRPVGLLFAGGGSVTFANPIDLVLQDLDIDIHV
jgi:hypothetical protein